MNKTKIISGLAIASLSASMAAPAHAEMTVEIPGRIDAIYTCYDEDEISMGSGTSFKDEPNAIAFRVHMDFK